MSKEKLLAGLKELPENTDLLLTLDIVQVMNFQCCWKICLSFTRLFSKSCMVIPLITILDDVRVSLKAFQNCVNEMWATIVFLQPSNEWICQFVYSVFVSARQFQKKNGLGVLSKNIHWCAFPTAMEELLYVVQFANCQHPLQQSASFTCKKVVEKTGSL